MTRSSAGVLKTFWSSFTIDLYNEVFLREASVRAEMGFEKGSNWSEAHSLLVLGLKEEFLCQKVGFWVQHSPL